MDIEELKIGIQKCENNAQSIFDDAELLYKNNRIPRSYSLYQLSIEEIGKCALIWSELGCFEKFNLKKFDKEFRSHKVKTGFSTSFDLMIYNSAKTDEMKQKLLKSFFDSNENVNQLNHFKNYSLYTTIIENKFIEPKNLIYKEKAFEIRENAKIRIYSAKIFNKQILDNTQDLIDAFKSLDVNNFVRDFIDNEKENIMKIIDSTGIPERG